MNRTTCAPVGTADVFAATGDDDAFGDRFPTHPIPVGALVQAPGGGASHREPARKAPRRARSTVLVVLVAVIVAVTGIQGLQSFEAPPPSAAPDARPRSAPAAAPELGPEADGRPRLSPPRSDAVPGARDGALGLADGAVPDGVTVFDDDVPAVANLDPALLTALRRAATDAARDGITFSVNSGWRSPQYQDQLLREAVSRYGSEAAAARWVATADTSLHVSGDAIDLGPTGATAWLTEHGAGYGLCQIYRNEPWHFELRPAAVDAGCPRMYADPTHDPRLQR